MSYGTMFTVLDDFRDRYGVSESRLGQILGAGFLAGFLAQVLLAPLADRGHARRMILAGMTLEIVSNLMMGFGTTFPVLLLARVMGGIGAGMVFPAVRRIVILADRENMGHNLGLLLSFDVGGFSAGPVLSAVTAGSLGLAAPFVLTSVALAAVAAGLTRVRVAAPVEDVARQRLAFDLLAIRGYLGTVIVCVALYLMIGTFDALWSVMMADLDAPDWVASVGITLFAAPMIFLGPRGGRFTARVGPLRASIVGLSLGTVFMAAYGTLPSANAMLAVGVLHGIVDGMTVTGGSAAVAVSVPPERLAAAQGLFGGFQTVTGGLAAVLAGSLYDAWGRGAAFLACSAGMAALIVGGTLVARGEPVLGRSPGAACGLDR